MDQKEAGFGLSGEEQELKRNLFNLLTALRGQIDEAEYLVRELEVSLEAYVKLRNRDR